ncbi:hypothetical protein [Limnoglobus roseus]|nr:hypothetical protein [Limnoglobus roseus]
MDSTPLPGVSSESLLQINLTPVDGGGAGYVFKDKFAPTSRS